MPTKLVTTAKNFLLVFVAISMTAFTPMLSMTAIADEPCTPPKSTTPGVHSPTGSSAWTYKYDCKLGLWVNDHYTYNPDTGAVLPKDPVVYTYNDSTGLYDTSTWDYVASDGSYSLRSHSVAQPPSGAIVVGAPKPVVTTQQPSGNNPSTPSTTGGNSTIGNNLDTTINNTNNTNATANNTIGQNTVTGNAVVFGNTTGGSATSGDASSLATIVNMLQSSGNSFGTDGNAVTFVSNINGDVNGDLLLDPAKIASIQNAGNGTVNNNANITVNNANNTNEQINNDINLASKSGNATVDSNTTAGNATTGSATAIANVLNFLNSTITSGKSFLGVININGNLNGDILLPPHFIDQLLSSNVPTVKINTGINTSVNSTNNTTQAINNNLNLTAVSGNASVDKNTTAGNATTGNGSTSITAFNLTGSKVVGSNDLLVFVNVLGKWYGMIFNAPGATSAQLGGGITENNKLNIDANSTNNTNQAINNNINLAAQSGDATVERNTTAGNATSGDAKSMLNLLNVTNTDLSLSNWFGVLFINVLGAWTGSFGINTAAGNPLASGHAQHPTANGTKSVSNGGSSGSANQVFRFVASTFGASTGSGTQSEGGGNGDVSLASTQKAVLAAHTDTTPSPTLSATASRNFWIPAFGLLLGTGILVLERVRSRQNKMI